MRPTITDYTPRARLSTWDRRALLDISPATRPTEGIVRNGLTMP